MVIFDRNNIRYCSECESTKSLKDVNYSYKTWNKALCNCGNKHITTNLNFYELKKTSYKNATDRSITLITTVGYIRLHPDATEGSYFARRERQWEIEISIDYLPKLICDGRKRALRGTNFREALPQVYSMTALTALIGEKYYESSTENPKLLDILSVNIPSNTGALWTDLISRYDYNRHKLIELLLNAGFSKLQTERLVGFPNLNKDASTPHQMLNISKHSLKMLKKLSPNDIGIIKSAGSAYHVNINLSENLHKFALLVTEDKIPWSADSFRIYSNSRFQDLIHVHNYDIQRLMGYLTQDLIQYQAIKPIEGLNLLSDYIRTCRLLDVTPDKYPKSLKLRHDVAAMHYREVKDEILAAKLKERLDSKEYKKLAGKVSKDYVLVAPRDAKDFEHEHDVLRHCINTYKERVAKGETTILFFRSRRDEQTPLVTVEVCNGAIRQVRGKHNRRPSDEERKALEGWISRHNLQVASYAW